MKYPRHWWHLRINKSRRNWHKVPVMKGDELCYERANPFIDTYRSPTGTVRFLWIGSIAIGAWRAHREGEK